MAPFTSISEVERIAGLSDPVLRNLLNLIFSSSHQHATSKYLIFSNL